MHIDARYCVLAYLLINGVVEDVATGKVEDVVTGTKTKETYEKMYKFC